MDFIFDENRTGDVLDQSKKGVSFRIVKFVTFQNTKFSSVTVKKELNSPSKLILEAWNWAGALPYVPRNIVPYEFARWPLSCKILTTEDGLRGRCDRYQI